MSSVNWIEGKAFVPDISEMDLQAGIARFTPLVMHDGILYRIEVPHLRNSAFTWEPKLLEAVQFTPRVEHFTDHYCGHPALFKPSIAEVLAQLPVNLPDDCNAFWIDVDAVSTYFDASGHRAPTSYGVMS